jgi:hypothetical protein
VEVAGDAGDGLGRSWLAEVKRRCGTEYFGTERVMVECKARWLRPTVEMIEVSSSTRNPTNVTEIITMASLKPVTYL